MKYFLIALSLCLFTFVNGQTYQNVALFKNGLVSEQATTTLSIQQNSNIHIDIPGKAFGLNLHKVDILSEDFYIETSSGKVVTDVDGVFYQGKIENNNNSIATVSMYNGEVVCSFSDEDGNFEICGDRSKPYTMRQISPDNNFQVDCYTQDYLTHPAAPESPQTSCKTIQVYFEADYRLYQDKGSSIPNAVNYITALFNQVSALYANEQINIQISQIKVWDTPDPYIQYTNISNVLTAFQTNVGPNFNGNIAHFLTTRNLGGGVGYIDVLCFKVYAFAASSITTSFQNIPTYSWSVEVVTHEIGHNIGSWHTQSCNWPGGALDNCYPTEGGCPPGPPPVNGGTIMSYCHLTQYGINFANGFGPVPGNYIRGKYNNAGCLSGTSAAPNGLQTTNITNTTATLQWNPVAGTQVYTVQYKQVNSSTWVTINVGLSTTYTLTGLTTNTQYHWQVKTDCSNYTVPVVFTTTGQGSDCSTIITPTVSNITQSSATISWLPLSGVTVYHLQYKTASATSWIEVGFISGTTYTLTYLAMSTTYMVRIRPSCSPNFGTIVQFTTQGSGGNCPSPTNLQVTNLTSTSAKLSWSAQTFATGYQLQMKFPGSSVFYTLGGTFLNNSVTFYGFIPASTYEWRVKNQCSSWSYSISFTTPANFIDQPASITPNPTTGIFRLEGVFGKGQLYNVHGQRVLEFDMNGDEIDVSNLSNGVYYLRIEGRVYKIVKI